jgi:hypothetical protein
VRDEAFQDAGAEMLDGSAGMKSAPGTQANQNVPMIVVPVLFSVRLYWKVLLPI